MPNWSKRFTTAPARKTPGSAWNTSRTSSRRSSCWRGWPTQVGEEAQPHVESVIVAWETWTELFFFHAFYFGYRSGLYWLEQFSPVQGLSKMMERVILTEYALGLTLPQVEQELHRELRMRRQKVQPPGGSRQPGVGKKSPRGDAPGQGACCSMADTAPGRWTPPQEEENEKDGLGNLESAHEFRRVHPLVTAGDREVDMGLQGLLGEGRLAHCPDDVAAGDDVPGQPRLSLQTGWNRW